MVSYEGCLNQGVEVVGGGEYTPVVKCIFEENPGHLFDMLQHQLGDFEKQEPTRDEANVINNVTEALHIFLQKLHLGNVGKRLVDKKISLNILPKGDIARLVGKPTVGVEVMGNVYIERTSDMAKFALVLSHEFAHAIAHKKMLCIVGECEDLKIDFLYSENGLSRVEEHAETRFVGVGEAVTEMMAREIRYILSSSSRRFRMHETDRLLHEISYPIHVYIMDELIDRLSANEQQKQRLRLVLFKDYITGTQQFFDFVKEHHSDIYTIISGMDDTNQDGITAAKALGYGDIVALFEGCEERE